MKLYRNKQSIDKQKKMYLCFISMIILGAILGFFFYFIISDSDKELIINIQNEFFSSISSNNIKYLSSFINSIFSNFIYIFLIFVLGLSVVGFVFIIVIVLVKSFIVGFSISSIIGTFGFRGILLSFVYVFPHQILFLIILLLMCFYGCSFCYKLFKHLFLRKMINFGKVKEKYFKVFGISLLGCLVCSLYEVFLLPIFINFFI